MTEPSPAVPPVAVLGLGVMGGSLLRDLSALGRPVRCWSPDAREVAAAGALPGVEPLDGPDGTAGCAGVVVATHLSAMPDLFRAVAATADATAWVVDLGSLQRPPVDWMAGAGLGERGVSCHPMAGREGSGFAASVPGLYREVRVWMSPVGPDDGAGGGALEAVRELWQAVGARPEPVDADRHDASMGWVSHLPQVVSVHLARVLEEAGYAQGALGSGGRDMTRLAGSGPAMWEDILRAEPGAVVPGLRTLADRLSRAADELEAGETGAFLAELEAGRRWWTGAPSREGGP